MKKTFAMMCICCALMIGLGSITGCPKSTTKKDTGTAKVTDIDTNKDTSTRDTSTKITVTTGTKNDMVTTAGKGDTATGKVTSTK